MTTYYEKLRDPRWQEKRLRIMDRDFFKCRECRSADKTLAVHHLYYEKGNDPWEYPDEALLTLCEECHKQAEILRLQLLKVFGQLWFGKQESVIGFAKATLAIQLEECCCYSEIELSSDSQQLGAVGAMATTAAHAEDLQNRRDDGWNDVFSLEDLRAIVKTSQEAINEIQ